MIVFLGNRNVCLCGRAVVFYKLIVIVKALF